eukprot:1641849-Amphidinium_carterae.1
MNTTDITIAQEFVAFCRSGTEHKIEKRGHSSSRQLFVKFMCALQLLWRLSHMLSAKLLNKFGCLTTPCCVTLAHHGAFIAVTVCTISDASSVQSNTEAHLFRTRYAKDEYLSNPCSARKVLNLGWPLKRLVLDVCAGARCSQNQISRLAACT